MCVVCWAVNRFWPPTEDEARQDLADYEARVERERVIYEEKIKSGAEKGSFFL